MHALWLSGRLELLLEFVRLVLLLDEFVAPLVGILNYLLQRLLDSLRLLFLHFLLKLWRAALRRLEGARICSVERDWPSLDFGEYGGWMRGEDVEEGLKGVVEDDLVILPGVYGTRLESILESGNLGLAAPDSSPGVELEVMVERDGLLARLLDEVDADGDLEFTPPDVTFSPRCLY